MKNKFGQEINLDNLATEYGVDRQGLSDWLDMIAFMESDRTDKYQGTDDASEGPIANLPAGGYYQIERGKDEGAMTRLTQSWLALPAELTPDYMERHVNEARAQGNTYDVKKKLYKEGQDYLMAAHILVGSDLSYNEDTKKHFIEKGKTYDGANLINAMVDAESEEAARQIFKDWYLDYHWAGDKGDPKIRKKKGEWFDKKMKHYKRNKDWADNTGPNSIFNEFNMDNFS
tara:strand:+ start:2341 stop:3030 length:690 start_codon:yes stop_codon:yes gene_type:complete